MADEQKKVPTIDDYVDAVMARGQLVKLTLKGPKGEPSYLSLVKPKSDGETMTAAEAWTRRDRMSFRITPKEGKVFILNTSLYRREKGKAIAPAWSTNPEDYEKGNGTRQELPKA